MGSESLPARPHGDCRGSRRSLQREPSNKVTTQTPHGRARYTKGCRCGVCREANRAYQRRYRAEKLKPVPDLPAAAKPAETREFGGDTWTRIESSNVVAEAVQRQLDELGVQERRPGLAAVALRLAELLDNPLALPQHPSAAGRLVEILGQLSKDTQRRGKLAAVRSLTNDR